MLLGVEMVKAILGAVSLCSRWAHGTSSLFLHRLFVPNKTFVKSTVGRVVKDLSVPSFRWSFPSVDGSTKGETINGLAGSSDAGPFTHSGSQGEVQGYRH